MVSAVRCEQGLAGMSVLDSSSLYIFGEPIQASILTPNADKNQDIHLCVCYVNIRALYDANVS